MRLPRRRNLGPRQAHARRSAPSRYEPETRSKTPCSAALSSYQASDDESEARLFCAHLCGALSS